MKTKFIVIDELGEVSRTKDFSDTQSFPAIKAAEKRAEELATFSPGDDIEIYQLVAKVKAPVGKPVTTTVKA